MTTECADFLRKYGFSEEQFTKTGLEWEMLDEVRARHTALRSELQNTATFVVERLQTVPEVHSLKARIKDAEHLVEKIIRKKCDRHEMTIDYATYEQTITDLVGVRVLHLFKEDWRPIHDFVTATWELHEGPIAYVRDGDGDRQGFADAGCRVEIHPYGYRSVHYIIKSQPAKAIRLVELQVRTIFEEGWSEIDHRVRYPRQSDDPHLALFLTIFNRLAGSADEMGTFTKMLATNIRELAATAKESVRLIQEKEAELQKTISQLQITTEAKLLLQRQIAEVNRPTALSLKSLMGQLSDPGEPILPPGYITSILGTSGGASLGAKMGIAASLFNLRRCHVCGKDVPVDVPLSPLSVLGGLPICPECASRK